MIILLEINRCDKEMNLQLWEKYSKKMRFLKLQSVDFYL